MGKVSFDGYRTQWPRVGGVLAMAVGGATTLAARKLSKPQLLSALNFGALLVHQYEEYEDPGWFPRPVQPRGAQERPAPQLSAQQNHGPVREHGLRLPVLPRAGPVPPQEVGGPEPGLVRDGPGRRSRRHLPRLAGDTYSPGFLASFFLHIPIGVTYIRALQAENGLSGGDIAKAAAYTAAFALVAVAGPNLVGRDRNSPYAFTKEQMGPHDVEPV